MTQKVSTNYRKDEFMQKSRTPAGATAINSGDLVYYDAVAVIAKPLDTDAHAATFMGVSFDSTPVDVYSGENLPTVNVAARGQFELNSTSGDTYNPGDKVYIGADAQTVTNTAGAMTHPIGTIAMDPSMVALAGGTGVKVLVDIVPAYPTVA